MVGEDLGVVPDEIRRALPEFGVYHYKVVLFEQKDGEFVAPDDYVRPALAAVTTHDLPTLRGWWTGYDIDLWEKLGFYADAGVGARNREERRQERLRRRSPAADRPAGRQPGEWRWFASSPARR